MKSYLIGPTSGRCSLILTKTNRLYRLSFHQKKMQLSTHPCFSVGMIIDSKFSFQSHVREAIIKARRGIGIIRFLSKYVSRDVLDQIYKLYVRTHLNYGDIIYHKYDPELDFTKKLESTKYSAALVVTGAWRRTNTDRLYKELGWEILYYRRDACVTFTNYGMIRDRITYTLKYRKK